MASYRIKLTDQKNSDFTYFEISELKPENKFSKRIIAPERENMKKNDLFDNGFDIRFSKNFLVLITNFKEIKVELLKDDNFLNKNFFLILGIVLNEKSNNTQSQKIVTNIKRENFMKFFKEAKSEWIEINLLPLEKITTFLRF